MIIVIISLVILYYVTSSKKDTPNITSTPNIIDTSLKFKSSATSINDRLDSVENNDLYNKKLNSNSNALNNFKLFKNISIRKPDIGLGYHTINTYYHNVIEAGIPVQCTTRCLNDSKCKRFIMHNSSMDKARDVGQKFCVLITLNSNSIKLIN